MRKNPASSSSGLVQFCLDALETGYRRTAWHGPNLRGALRGVDVELAAWRPADARRNIWEIAVHAAYWKYVVRRSVTGEKRGSFPLKGSNWFARGADLGSTQWRDDLALLDTIHESLLEVVRLLGDGDLERASGKRKLRIRDIVLGGAMHDVYHAGQIQTLRRLHGSR